MATSNPAFSQDIFAGYNQVYGGTRSTVTTVQGTMGKTFLLLAIMTATALWSFHAVAAGELQLGVIPVAGIAGFILAMVTIFKPTVAPWTSPVYAAMEGVFLGAISQIVEMRVRQGLSGHRPAGGDADVGHACWSCCSSTQRDRSGSPSGSSRGSSWRPAPSACSTSSRCMLSDLRRDHAADLERDADRHRLQPLRGRPGGVQPAARLRFHRGSRPRGRCPSTWSGTAPSA